MRSLVATTASLSFACAMMAAPVLADTTPTDPNNTNQPGYLQHAGDCLALLFTNPKLHDEECGGPFHDIQQPASSTTGFGPACVGEIGPQDLHNGEILVAQNYCCSALTAPVSAFWVDGELAPIGRVVSDLTLEATGC